MSQELLYTSAPNGLKPGSRGFCTVLSTQGMSAPLASALESLSGYRPVYPASDERASRNPVVFSHLKMQAAGRSWHVLSRVADYGLDYSQRANKLAHHVVLDQASERLPGGPANLLSMSGFMREEWSGEPKVVALKPVTREPRPAVGPCRAWAEMTGDAGWAGVLAESFLKDPDRLVIILFAPGQDILPLFSEAISLLPPDRRWDVTFSTYFTGLATGTTCVWRAMVHDSKEAHDSLRFVNALRIDLTADSFPAATDAALVEAARTGNRSGSLLPGAPETGGRPSGTVDAFTRPVEFTAYGYENSEGAGATPKVPPKINSHRPPILNATETPAPRNARRLADVVAEEARRNNKKRSLLSAYLCVAAAVSLGLAFLFLMKGGTTKRAAESPTASSISSTASTPVEQFSKETAVDSGDAKTVANIAAVNPANVSGASETNGTSPAAVPEPATSHGGDQAETVESPHEAESTAVQKTASATVSTTANLKESESKWAPTLAVEDFPSDHEWTVIYRQPKPVAVGLAKVHVLKPSWLPYVPKLQQRRIGKRDVDRAIVDPANSTEPVVLAQFSWEFSDVLSLQEYSIKLSQNENRRFVSWYCFLFECSQVHPLPIAVHFAPFPLDGANIGRSLYKGQLVWRLPESLPMSGVFLPKFQLEELRISIGGDTNSVELEGMSPASRWDFPLKDFTKKAFDLFGIVPAKNNIPFLQIEISNKNEIIFSVRNVAEFKKVVRQQVEKGLKNTKSMLLKYLDSIESGLANEYRQFETVDNLLKKIHVIKGVNQDDVFPLKAILEKVESGLEQRSIDDAGRARLRLVYKQLSAEVDALREHVRLYSRFIEFSDELEEISLDACKLYYDLVCADDSSLNMRIYVVNFDTPSGGPEEGAGEPRK